MKLRFGTAGIPVIAKGLGTEEGIKKVKEIGLEAMELEFVHSVNITPEKTPLVKEAAKKNDVTLTCHGSYYINLNAQDKAKLEASKNRLVKCAEISGLCGAESIAFHPGFYMKMDKEPVYNNVKKALKQIVEKLRNKGSEIWLAPETTGKHTQFGNLDETIKLSQDVEQVHPCIDYAHLRARDLKNDRKEFSEVLEKIENKLGKEALKNMHIQFAGVNFSEKGELNHLELEDSDLNYAEMVETWKDFNIAGVAISESPNIEKDAILLKKVYDG